VEEGEEKPVSTGRRGQRDSKHKNDLLATAGLEIKENRNQDMASGS
jgi:hypothetical protein